MAWWHIVAVVLYLSRYVTAHYNACGSADTAECSVRLIAERHRLVDEMPRADSQSVSQSVTDPGAHHKTAAMYHVVYSKF